MAAASENDKDGKLREGIVQQIKKVAERMKRPQPTRLRRSNGAGVELSNDFIDNLADGKGLEKSEWLNLIGLLLVKQIPSFDMVPTRRSWRLFDWLHHDGDNEVKVGDKRFCLQRIYTSVSKRRLCWMIQEFQGSKPVIKMYTVRQTYGNYQSTHWVNLSLESWKTAVNLHRETSLTGSEPELYEDAILFDMLLDLATDNFKPHTRTIEDGPAIQLEIPRALEKLQKEAEAVAAAEAAVGKVSKKRRLTVQEKLDGKRLKEE